MERAHKTILRSLYSLKILGYRVDAIVNFYTGHMDSKDLRMAMWLENKTLERKSYDEWDSPSKDGGSPEVRLWDQIRMYTCTKEKFYSESVTTARRFLEHNRALMEFITDLVELSPKVQFRFEGEDIEFAELRTLFANERCADTDDAKTLTAHRQLRKELHQSIEITNLRISKFERTFSAFMERTERMTNKKFAAILTGSAKARPESEEWVKTKRATARLLNVSKETIEIQEIYNQLLEKMDGKIGDVSHFARL